MIMKHNYFLLIVLLGMANITYSQKEKSNMKNILL